MKKLLVSHFRNEEYLLPFWLKHHKKHFDHGVLVDYKSTDNSVNIIKEICPEWEVVPSKNELLATKIMDREIEDIENQYPGWWRTCLTATEFLIGDWAKLNDVPNQKIMVPAFNMVEHPAQEGVHPDLNIDLFLQKTNGIHYDDPISYSEDLQLSEPRFTRFLVSSNSSGWKTRRSRLIHNSECLWRDGACGQYPMGRHFEDRGEKSKDFVIIYYRFCPYNEAMLRRMVTMRENIVESDGKNGLGIEHFFTEEDTKTWVKEWQANSRDLSKEIHHYLNLSK
jgi:hypothetical protein